MSQKNIEVVREAVKAFVDGDMERLATFYTPNGRISDEALKAFGFPTI
jgi:hypothetical protein